MACILVVGGGGFIGSHVCKKLIDEGHEVISIDIFTTGNKKNIEDIIGKKNFTSIQEDVCESSIIKKFSEKKIDEIYHLASPASVTYITDHPIEAALANSLGTKNLLELALIHKSKILFASSSEAYGDPKEHPQKESYRGNVNPVGVRSGYDEGKRFGEALCMAYHREKGIDVKIVRIFNTYGPRSRPNDTRVVPQFAVQALSGKDLTVHGDGQQTRSFCYVSDMVEGFISMMKSAETGPINLGNPTEYKIIDVAKKIIDLTGSPSKIAFIDRPPDDPAVRRPDITLANEKLHWSPTVSFDDGLPMTVKHLREILQRNERV